MMKNQCQRGVFLFFGIDNEKNDQKTMKKIYVYVKINKMVENAHYMGGYANYHRIWNDIISYIRNRIKKRRFQKGRKIL